MQHHFFLGLTATLLLAGTGWSQAAETPVPPAKKAPVKEEKPTKWDLMETGPFFTCGFGGKYPAYKAISVRLGEGEEAAVSFDTELLRFTMGWTDGFLHLPKGRGGLEGIPEPEGTPVFWTPGQPGWARFGSFTDPRPKAEGKDWRYGPLPHDWAHYEGLYRYGKEVIFSYTVGKAEVLDMPGYAKTGDLKIFTRTLQLSGGGLPLTMALCEGTKFVPVGKNTYLVNTSTNAEDTILVTVVNAPSGARFETGRGCLDLKLSGFTFTKTFQILIARGGEKSLPALSNWLKIQPPTPSLKKLCQGGPGLWKETVVTKGVLGKEAGPYQVDTLTLPEENPWKSWIRPGGFDFFSDGERAAVCSVSGDVWIVSGIDASLDRLTWKRFATGLFQPLGLKIVKNTVYVTGRDQITRLLDLNRDGEADFYENFNNDVCIGPHYHEFALNLETDSKGNFYFTKGGNLTAALHPHHGTLLKVSRDGKKLEVVATGLRAPNGLSIGPKNEITTSDNEGNWVPASRVNLIKPGGFYGHVSTAHRTVKPTTYDNPLFWLSHSGTVDNSSGGQVWVKGKKWGPFAGSLLHTSYGTCSLFLVMKELVGGQWQAGVTKFPLKFESGIMRGRFNARDGQLYLCGLNVWQSNAAKEGAFQRVRYTGKPVFMPQELHVRSNGLALTFTAPLDAPMAKDLGSYGIEQWNYQWTANYGSPEMSALHPEEKGHDTVEIKSVQLSADRRTVFLEIPDIRPVMQMKIQYDLQAVDGTPMQSEIYGSIFKVPGQR